MLINEWNELSRLAEEQSTTSNQLLHLQDAHLTNIRRIFEKVILFEKGRGGRGTLDHILMDLRNFVKPLMTGIRGSLTCHGCFDWLKINHRRIIGSFCIMWAYQIARHVFSNVPVELLIANNHVRFWKSLDKSTTIFAVTILSSSTCSMIEKHQAVDS